MNLQGFLLSYKSFETTTKRCLESLLPQAATSGVTVFLGDNGSPDESPLLIAQYVNQLALHQPKQSQYLRTTYFDENFGYAGGMNRLTMGVPADWLLLIGSDTVFSPNALQNLIWTLTHAPESTGIIGPVTNSAGTAQCLSFESDTPEEMIEEWETLHSVATNWLTPIYRADFFCVAIRKSLWDQLNGLDEGYGRGYYEDVDFCVRARRAGFNCGSAEDCFVYHQGSATFKKESGLNALIKKNKIRFLEKYPDALLPHLREDTYNAVKSGLATLEAEHHYGARLNRIKNRMRVLESQKPKSFYKKIFWSQRSRHLNQEIEALF